MEDRRTILQKVRGIKREEVQNYAIPTENDDYFYNIVQKSYDGKTKAVTSPSKDDFQVLGVFDIQADQQGFARKISRTVPRDVVAVLRAYSNNPIIRAIINTRVNQVTNFAHPAGTAQDGIGYRVRKADGTDPTDSEKREINRCMRFLRFMGKNYDPNRDDFPTFLRKLTRDSLIYDQVPIERIYDTSQGTPDNKAILNHIQLVDPTTFVFLTDKRTGKRKRTGKVYGQVLNKRLVRQFDTSEMSVFIRNKSSDLLTNGYGTSELESSLREVFAQENAEEFNDRFFTNGGTVRGILNVKTAGNTSRMAQEAFSRRWHSALTGINGSWSIPMITADDVKFVNLTPQAQDMQFEKWFNYLINSICAIYSIDPSEIGMTNRGGATGSKGNSLNEGNSKDKIAISKDKGLRPLLALIADFITNEIIFRITGNSSYIFEFVGQDLENRIQEATLDKMKSETYLTVNEIRIAKGLPSLGAKGDVILNGSWIQHKGQIQQQELTKNTQQMQRLQTLDTYIQDAVEQPDTPDLNGVSYQDMQAGMNGKPAKPSGKKNQQGVGKDGQAKNVENTNSSGQGGKNHKKK